MSKAVPKPRPNPSQSADTCDAAEFIVDLLIDANQIEILFRLEKSILARFPHCFNVWHQFAQLHISQDDAEEAMRIYEAWLGRHGDLAKAWHWYAMALDENGKDADLIVECYEQAVALEPDNANWRVNLGNAYADDGDVEAALDAYEAAITLEPNLWVAYTNAAHTLMDVDKLPEAVQMIERIDQEIKQRQCDISGWTAELTEVKQRYSQLKSAK